MFSKEVPRSEVRLCASVRQFDPRYNLYVAVRVDDCRGDFKVLATCPTWMNDVSVPLLGRLGGESRPEKFRVFVSKYRWAEVGIFLNPLLAMVSRNGRAKKAVDASHF